MAVITKYVVVRDGVELEPVFDDKREAVAYDKMLDAADELARLIRSAELPVPLEDPVVEALAVCLARNGAEVTRILKGVRPLDAGIVAEPAAPDASSPGAGSSKRGSKRSRNA